MMTDTLRERLTCKHYIHKDVPDPTPRTLKDLTPLSRKIVKVYSRNVRKVYRTVRKQQRESNSQILTGIRARWQRNGKPRNTTKLDDIRTRNVFERRLIFHLKQIPSPIVKASFSINETYTPVMYDQIGDEIEKVADWNTIHFDDGKQVGNHYLDIYGESAKVSGHFGRLSASWDVVNVKAVEWAARRAARLVTEVTVGTKAALREIVSNGIQQGYSIPTIARRIREVDGVGLNVRQQKALIKYTETLEKSGISGIKLQRKVTKQYKKKLAYRAEMIARTETATAMSAGTLEGYEERGVQKVRFEASADACIVCLGYDGIVTRRADPFQEIPVHPNCVRKDTVVYTSKGWLPIYKIQMGDLVLTHEGRYRKVVQKHKNLVNCEFTRYGIRSRQLTVTSNHPVLTKDGWVEAGKLQDGDEAIRWSGTCRVCGGPTWFDKDVCHKQNCYTEAAHDSMRESVKNGSWHLQGLRPEQCGEKNPAKRPEVRKKISESKMGDKNPTRMYPELGRAQSRRLKKLFAEHPEKHPNAILAKKCRDGKGGKTWIETRMGEVLAVAGIDAEYNHNVGNKWLDYAIVDEKIAIECDGEYWHKDKEKERLRDEFLEVRGWTVLHFTGSRIRTDVSGCLDEVQRLLANHAGEYRFSPISIKVYKRYRKKVTVYNLSVEEDESYVARGFVVHNCRCTWIPVLSHPTPKEAAEIKRPPQPKPVTPPAGGPAPPVTGSGRGIPLRPGVPAGPPKTPMSQVDEVKAFVKGPIESEAPLGGGVNESMKVHIKGDGDGVYKPSLGEQGNMRPSMKKGTYAQREVAASIVDEEAAWDLVPKTVRKTGSKGTGSVQKFADNAEDWLKGGREKFFERPSAVAEGREALSAAITLQENSAAHLNIFDVIIGNTDRHGGNLMVKTVKGKPKLVAIDHGLAFQNAAAMKEAASRGKLGLRLLFDSYDMPEKLPKATRTALNKMLNRRKQITAKLSKLLSKEEIDGMWARAEWLQANTAGNKMTLIDLFSSGDRARMMTDATNAVARMPGRFVGPKPFVGPKLKP